MLFTMYVNEKNKMIKIIFPTSFCAQNSVTKTSTLMEFPDYTKVSEDVKSNTATVTNIGDAAITSILASAIPILIFSNF